MTLLRLRYLKVYRDRHGTVRRYFHKRGQKDLPLKGEPGTTEFMLAYQAAFGATAPVVDETKAGTFARLIADYCRSSAFANLKPSSQKLYKLVLDRIAERHGHRLVRDARRSDARKMVEEIGSAKPAMANITRAVLRLLMQYAVETELRLDNPVTGLKAYRTGTRHTWTDDELAQFERRWPLGTRERLAFALLLYTGQRAAQSGPRNLTFGWTPNLVQGENCRALILPVPRPCACLRRYADLGRGPSDRRSAQCSGLDGW